MSKFRMKVECNACNATGLYQGFMEAKNEAVICLGCKGMGFVFISGNKFEGRKKQKGIKTIRKSRGSFIATGVGGFGETMTYAEFLKKFPEKERP